MVQKVHSNKVYIAGSSPVSASNVINVEESHLQKEYVLLFLPDCEKVTK